MRILVAVDDDDEDVGEEDGNLIRTGAVAVRYYRSQTIYDVVLEEEESGNTKNKQSTGREVYTNTGDDGSQCTTTTTTG